MAATPVARWHHVLFLTLIWGTRDITGMQSNYALRPVSSYHCDNFESDVSFDMNFRDKDDSGVYKVADMEFTLDKPVTDKWMFAIKIDRWNNGMWDENFYNMEGGGCDHANSYIKTVWMRFREELEPSLSGDCDVEPGTYKIKDFEVFRNECDFPVAISGRYRVTTTLDDEEGVGMICQVFEMETVE